MLRGNSLSAEVLKVKMIEIDENGEVMTRLPKTDYEGQLNRTLLLALYPDIRVVQIQVPKMLLDRFEEKQVASRLASVTIDDAKYCLVGGTGSVKDGVFYAVDAKHKDVIAKRFQNWPQAAITYLGILLSDCRVLIEYPEQPPASLTAYSAGRSIELRRSDFFHWLATSVVRHTDQTLWLDL